MENKEIIFYASLLLIVASAAEIFVRIKGYGAKIEKDRKGVTIPYKPRLAGPIMLFIAAVIVAITISLQN